MFWVFVFSLTCVAQTPFEVVLFADECKPIPKCERDILSGTLFLKTLDTFLRHLCVSRYVERSATVSTHRAE